MTTRNDPYRILRTPDSIDRFIRLEELRERRNSGDDEREMDPDSLRVRDWPQ